MTIWESQARRHVAWLAALVLLTVGLVTTPALGQTIVGFDARCIQIDAKTGGTGANIVVDAGTANNLPVCSNTYIDWITLSNEGKLADHTITDGIGNNDGSIVGAQDILTSGSTLPKEDIYRLYASNNIQWLYLAMARRANNGNSNWHWFFTKLAPDAVPGQPIVYHFQDGDFEVRVCFPRGSDPAGFTAQVYQVQGLGLDGDGNPVVVDSLASDIWTTVPLVYKPSAIGAFTINTVVTTALPGSLDSHGDPSTTYDVATFAEGAASLTQLGISPCNSSAYVTVLTRSSCSLTSDLKDTTTPVQYNFGTNTVSIETPTIGCTGASGAAVTLTAVGSAGTPPYTFVWKEGTTTLGTDNPLTYTFAAGEHTVTVTCTDSVGCVATKDVTFTVLPQVTASIGAPTIACTSDSGASVTLTATAGGGDGTYSYAWKEGATDLGTGNPLVYTFAAGSHTVSVTVTDGKGCTATASRTFTVLPQVTASIGTPTIACTTDSGASVTLTATAGGGDGTYSYAWKEGTTDLGTGNPLTYTFAAGSHTVTVTITDGRGCTATANRTFTVLPKLTVSLATPTIACTVSGSASVTLSATAEGGDGAYTFSWSEGSSVIDGNANPLTTTFTVGSHTVKVTVTDGRGCTAEATVTFTVLPGLSVELDILSSLDCVSSVLLQATASGGSGDYTYTWKVGNTIVFTDHQSGGGPSQYTAVFDDDDYCDSMTVSVSVTDSHDCTTPPPAPSITLTKTTEITAD